MHFKLASAIAIIFSQLVSHLAYSSEVTSRLDLQGRGNLEEVALGFNYVALKDGDIMSMTYQGGFIVYDIAEDQNHVALIGPLRPCIAIAVTDGVKLITIHKHVSNSLEQLAEVLKEHLNFENQDLLQARIFTTKDDVEWKETGWQSMHGGNTHTQEVLKVKNLLDQLGIQRHRIPANFYNLRDKKQELRYTERYLNRYDAAQKYVAIRLDDLTNSDGTIKFASLDPYREKMTRSAGLMISELDFPAINFASGRQVTGEMFFDRVECLENQRMLPFNKIAQYLPLVGIRSADQVLMNILRFEREVAERKAIETAYGMRASDLFTSSSYNTLPFYQISKNN